MASTSRGMVRASRSRGDEEVRLVHHEMRKGGLVATRRERRRPAGEEVVEIEERRTRAKDQGRAVGPRSKEAREAREAMAETKAESKTTGRQPVLWGQGGQGADKEEQTKL